MFRIGFMVWIAVLSCSANAQHLSLSTPSDSALHYYYEGWRQVMDEGNYTASENAYRTMMNFDPEFLVGLSLLGRITRDLNERQKIEATLLERRDEISGDERLLLDNYIALVKLTNLRETDPDAAKQQLTSIFQSNEKNLRKLVHDYPDEIYYKSEYIEVLHRNYGAAAALDSLNQIASAKQKRMPFLLGYAAHMEAELGKFDPALKKANQLSKLFKYRSAKPLVVFGDIYFQKGDKKKASDYINKALEIDPGNIDAQRLKKRLEELN